MKNPIDLEITIQAKINPTEKKEKVVHAIENIFPSSKYMIKDDKTFILSNNFEILYKIKEQTKSRQTISVLKRILYNNYNENITWFLLNKQAAFSGVVAIVEEEDESPLGPIKITIKNYDLDRINQWLDN